MDIQTAKLEIIKFVLNSDKKAILSRLLNIVESAESADAVAHSIHGQPLDLTQYQAELQKAEKEIARGECMTSDELEKEISSWK